MDPSIDFSVLPQETIEEYPIDQAIPHPENPRIGDLDAIADSMEKNGFYGDIKIQKSTRYILVGNHRWQVFKLKGKTTIRATLLDVDDALAKRIMLADNRTSQLGTFDPGKLAESLLAESDLGGTGYDDLSIEDVMVQAAAAQAKSEGRAEQEDAPQLDPKIGSFSLVFDTVEQKESWGRVLKNLKKLYPEEPTITARVLRFVNEDDGQ